MDWLEAVSSWIGSLAWPVVVLVLGIVLKSQIGDAIGKLRHVEAAGVKADFGDELAEAEATAGVVSAELPASPPASADATAPEAPAHGDTAPGGTTSEAPATEPRPQIESPNYIDPLRSPGASSDPSGLIMRMWQAVYAELEEYAHVTDALPRSRKNPNRSASILIRTLNGRDFIGDDAAALITDLSDLRNKVAHGRHVPTPGEALAYEGTAAAAINYLRHRQGQETNFLAAHLRTPRV